MTRYSLALAFFLLIPAAGAYAQVAINSDGSQPNSSAMLDVKSTSKGLLPPRMTSAQRNAISSPASGLIIFCTDCGPCGLMQIVKNNLWIDMGPGCDGTGNNAVPIALYVSQTGNSSIGATLTGHYTYSDAEQDHQSASSYEWFRADNGSGLNEASITGATSLTYKVVSADLGKYIRFAVTPAAQTGSTPGIQVKSGSFSGPVIGNLAPEASVVTQSGTAQTYIVLTGSYTYFDAEADQQGISQFQWYRANDSYGAGEVTIGGATSLSYTLAAADLTKYIRFSVRPVSLTGTSPGTLVKATVFLGPVTAGNSPPAASSVVQNGYTWEGAILLGTYTYSDIEGDLQGTSLYQWFRSDNNAGLNETAISGANSINYTVVNADDGKWIRLGVIPVAQTGSSPGPQVKAAAFAGPMVRTTACQDVTNTTTGRVWHDRNLGAKRVALSYTDGLAFGSYFQWGRLADGHELINWTPGGTGSPVNGTTAVLSTTDVPGHSLFIIGANWRSPANNFLWQGVSGTNNPCPSGYRLPSIIELEAEKSSWAISNIQGGFSSPLKFTIAGIRVYSDGSIGSVNSYGYYWTSTVSVTAGSSWGLEVHNLVHVDPIILVRGYGMSVRCIMDYPNNTNYAPAANNVTETGNLWEGAILSGSYTYSDAEGDIEGSSIYAWLRADNSAGLNESVISGATSQTYQLISGDANKYIRFAVTPVALTGTTPGLQAKAAGYKGPVVGQVAYTDVTNTVTGKIWLNRNIGAFRVATSKTDFYAYGSLFQWGRLADGHELIEWTGATTGTPLYGTTATTSSSDVPGHHFFIMETDWRSPKNDNLWQGVSGINNPCPTGYRIPTRSELDDERSSWTQQNRNGAYTSPLKFPVQGYRVSGGGYLGEVGISSLYSSSTVSGNNCLILLFDATTAFMSVQARGHGYPVRCIKD